MKYGKDVRFVYYRRYDNSRSVPSFALDYAIKEAGLGHHIVPTGGYVRCELMWDGKIYATGDAVCSVQDNFNYRIGREMSYGRAIKEAKAKLKEQSIRQGLPAGADMAISPENWVYSQEAGGWVHTRPSGRTIYPQVQSTT